MWGRGYPLCPCVAGDLRRCALRSCAQGLRGGSSYHGVRRVRGRGGDVMMMTGDGGHGRGGNDDSSQDDSDGGGGCAWAKDGYLLRGKPNREGGASRDMTFDDGGSIEKWGGSPLVLCISSPKKLHVFV